MYMDVDEVAYPEGHTLWDKVRSRRSPLVRCSLCLIAAAAFT